MTLLECLKSALSSITANKMRSLLTMLGIIIGISSVITITTLGASLTATIESALSSIGSIYYDVYVEEIWDYDEETNEWTSLAPAGYEPEYVSFEMLNALNQAHPNTVLNSSETGIGSATVTNSDRTTYKVRMGGILDGYLQYMNFKLLSGRNITLRDAEEYRHTVLVSDIFVRQYCKHGEEPIGMLIPFTLEDGTVQEFTVVGVFQFSEIFQRLALGNVPEEEMSTFVFVPYTMESELRGTPFEGFRDLSFISASTETASTVSDVLKEFFTEQYADYPYLEVRFYCSIDDVNMVQKVISIVTIVISIIAAISLIVGGVGVMNIMLVSVTERTREIGIRKALGAKRGNIRLQFIIESIVICLIGGIIGILIGILNGELVGIAARLLLQTKEDFASVLSDVKIVPSAAAIIISVVFSTLTGVFFGLYPANKAAKMHPIDALRYD